ncbi:MAG: PIN domain-containing protein [bacterium]
MREKVFIDTSALYALADSRDEHHKKAREIYKKAIAGNVLFVLTDLVIAETSTLIRRRLGFSASSKLFQIVEEGEGVGLFSVHFVDKELYKKAREIFLQLQDPKFSFVDAGSIALMKKEKIGKYFAFDAHFRRAGFESI